MKKIYTTFVLFLCFLLILGLSVSAQESEKSKVISYHGESEHWLGDFTIEFKGETITKLGKIKYKGEDIDSVGLVLVTFDTITGKSTSSGSLAGLSTIDSPIGEKGTRTSRGIIGSNDQVNDSYSKLEVVKVSVEWSEKTESFNLYKK